MLSWVLAVQGEQTQTCPDMVVVSGLASTGWETWHGIQFNGNSCVDSVSNQNPFSLPAGWGWLPVMPEPSSVSPAGLLLNTRDILWPVVYPLYPQYLLENLSSAATSLLPVAHFRQSTWYWLELINTSIVLFLNVELGVIMPTWQLVIWSPEG